MGSDVSVTDDLALSLANDDHDVHFIHLDDVDGAGHSNGFSPVIPTYLAAIGQVDEHIGTVVDPWLVYASEPVGDGGLLAWRDAPVRALFGGAGR